MQHHLDQKSLNPLPLAPAFSASFSRAPFSRLFPASTSQRGPGEPPNTVWGPPHPSHLGNTGCKQISKFTLIGSTGNGNSLQTTARSGLLTVSVQKDLTARQGGWCRWRCCKIHACSCPCPECTGPLDIALPCYKFWWSLPEAKSCWNMYQCAVTQQTLEGKVLYLKQGMIKILDWHTCDI